MHESSAFIRLYGQFIRWAFCRLYHEFAWSYNAVAWTVSAGLWRRWAVTPLWRVRGATLELGCGTGYLQAALGWGPPRVFAGIDASPQMLRHARERLRDADLPSRLVRGVAQRLPFPDATFATAIATFPAEYIIDPQVAAEVRRVLTADGQLLIVDGAQFLRADVHTRLADAAFRATLQTSIHAPPPLPRYLQPFEAEGFRFTVEWLYVAESRVMLMRGTRG